MRPRDLAMVTLLLASGMTVPAHAGSATGGSNTDSGDSCARLVNADSPLDTVVSAGVENRNAPETRTVSALLVEAVDCGIILAGRAAGMSDEPEREGPPYEPPRGTVDFTCTDVTMTVTPDYWDYYVTVFAVDTRTNQPVRATFGPFSGTITEPVGSTVTIVRVEIRVGRRVVATGSIPERCEPDSAIDYRSTTRTNATSIEAVSTA